METLTFTGTIAQIQRRLAYMIDDGKQYDLTIKVHRNKRSLDANAYMWEIICKIADYERANKEDVYKIMLERYGQSSVWSYKDNISLEDLGRWFRHVKPLGKVVYGGQQWNQCIGYLGSSQYDTRQMSILIDGVVSEANEYGIPTITDEQLNKIKGAWGK